MPLVYAEERSLTRRSGSFRLCSFSVTPIIFLVPLSNATDISGSSNRSIFLLSAFARAIALRNASGPGSDMELQRLDFGAILSNALLALSRLVRLSMSFVPLVRFDMPSVPMLPSLIEDIRLVLVRAFEVSKGGRTTGSKCFSLTTGTAANKAKVSYCIKPVTKSQAVSAHRRVSSSSPPQKVSMNHLRSQRGGNPARTALS
mmetsp:Transcript_22405/g.36867  ORF Transcript_22405/g.36867 Transcript_22405/m.36867 type:complete len:202 (+) Transcript_22405:100-705(+)